MERRKFINQSTLLALGALLTPTLLSTSCRDDILFEDINYDGKVLIIGAGAAGLYAGYILQSKGIDFQILEASDVLGGRLGKLEGFADFPLDLGAQWLHGGNSILADLIRQTNTTITLDNSDTAFWFNQHLVSSLPKDLNAIFEEDNLPDISVKDYAIQKGFGSEYEFLVEQLAGDQGADASKLSAHWNQKEEENWVSGDADFKFRETFFDLFNNHIVPNIQDQIQLDIVIRSIDYQSNTITATDSNNQIYTADKVILTVPITVLKDGDINFIPALPGEKTDAFSKIGMDAGMKVFLKFNQRFYNGNTAGGQICAAYADETEGKVGNDQVLLGFIMGKQAEYLTSLGNDNAIINALLGELDVMYDGKATPAFINGYVQNWTNHPFIRGAYSYSTIGMGNARTTAAQTVQDRLYFAGEAMNISGHHQTVHGAAESGYKAVIDILNSVNK